ncbi:hypothetical protein [Sphingomonas daechungensis]|uniref:hypothetical protein n=1 Tax=Sphingomonas daechungensis TaxID=1176646 RepID=UPI003783A321
MRNLILIAGVAALAITAPAAAKPDKGGGGHGGGGGQHAQQQQQRGGGGGQQAQRQRGGGGGGRQAQMQRMDHGGGRQMQANRGGGQKRDFQRKSGGNRQAQRVERSGPRFANFQSDRGHGAKQERRNGGDRRVANVQSGHGRNRFERRPQRVERQAARMDNRSHRDGRVEFQNKGGRDDRRFAQERGTFRDNVREFAPVRAFEDSRRAAFVSRDDFRQHAQWRDWNDGDWDRNYGYRGIPAAYVGCPPGLAKKSRACVPPGLARERYVGQALPDYYRSSYLPLGLRDIYYDTPDHYYRYGDGYVYRVNRGDNLISALLPLIGAGYGVGQYFPYYNEPSYYVPSYYQSFYPDTPYDYYRYDDGYVYRVDAGSGYIEDVIPLLDRGYGIGQMMPAGYSYYNVPYQYRDYYPDTADYSYRYAPGAIYQVDRDSQLITAIASLLTGGLSVGQPLPPAYSVYNVPIDYRDRYYDRPDAWYRYSDGYIYQVDPTTQLITAMVQALV